MKKFWFVVALASIQALSYVGAACGQAVPQISAQPAVPKANVAVQTIEPTTGAGALTIEAHPTGQLMNMYYGPQSHSPVAQLVKQLGETEDSAKKEEITKQLESEVEKSFDRDMEERETELTKLEERIRKLRTQLDRRRKAKNDILQLQMKVLVNEAEGLGFSQSASPNVSTLPRVYTRSAGATGSELPALPKATRSSR